MNLEKLAKKIENLKFRYCETAKSLSDGFAQEAEGKYFNIHCCSSSHLKDLPLLAKEINILEALLSELLELKEEAK